MTWHPLDFLEFSFPLLVEGSEELGLKKTKNANKILIGESHRKKFIEKVTHTCYYFEDRRLHCRESGNKAKTVNQFHFVSTPGSQSLIDLAQFVFESGWYSNPPQEIKK